MPAKKKDFYTYADAQAAVQKLGIKRQSDYSKRYREDPTRGSRSEVSWISHRSRLTSSLVRWTLQQKQPVAAR